MTYESILSDLEMLLHFSLFIKPVCFQCNLKLRQIGLEYCKWIFLKMVFCKIEFCGINWNWMCQFIFLWKLWKFQVKRWWSLVAVYPFDWKILRSILRADFYSPHPEMRMIYSLDMPWCLSHYHLEPYFYQTLSLTLAFWAFSLQVISSFWSSNLWNLSFHKCFTCVKDPWVTPKMWAA